MALPTTRRALLLVLAGCATGPGDGRDPPDGPARHDPFPPVDTDPSAVVDGAAWAWSDEVVCADPSARTARPMVLHDPGGDWDRQPVDPASPSLFVGGGVGVADFTGDGRLDLMITARDRRFRLWVQGDGLTFHHARDALPPLPPRTAGVTPVDHDDDGDMDAFVSVFRGPDVLLDNDGAGRFTDVAERLGLQGPPHSRSISSAWADVDRDGALDAFVAAYGRLPSGDGTGLPDGDPSSLFLRGPDGRFVDVTAERADSAALQAAHTFTGSWNDVDGDGWPDLFLVNDFGWTWPSLLLRNRGGHLDEVAVGVELTKENMGLGVGDLNGDEVPDFLVTAWDDYGLFISEPGGRWYEASRAVGLRPDLDRGQRTAWGTELADLDNDGDLDAVVVFGHLPVRTGNANPLDQPDAVYLQGDDGRFTDVAPAWGVDDPGRARGLAVVDLDRNGFLDLVRVDLVGATRIHLGTCDRSAWLAVALEQAAPNRHAVGARVRVGAGGRVWTRDVRAGGTSYGSAGPPEVHVGLGDVDVVDFVEVVWPDGSTSRRQHVPTRRFLRVARR